MEEPGWNNAAMRMIQDIQTISKRLELPSRSTSKKPPLTEKMIKKRLTYCEKHKASTEKDWEIDKSALSIINPKVQKV